MATDETVVGLLDKLMSVAVYNLVKRPTLGKMEQASEQLTSLLNIRVYRVFIEVLLSTEDIFEILASAKIAVSFIEIVRRYFLL